jgi:hypothetical protein
MMGGVFMKNTKIFMFSCGILFSGMMAEAATWDFDEELIEELGQTAVNSIMDTISLGADHRAYQSASALGIALGFDVGISVTVIPLPKEFQDGLDSIGVNSFSMIPLPRLSAHKGLPFGVNVGLSYVGGVLDAQIIGADIQYAVINNIALPSVSVRGSFTSAQLGFISSTTYGLDVMASKNLLVADPYVGLGWRLGNSEVDFGDAEIGDLETTRSISDGRLVAGTALKFGPVRFTPEVVMNFGGLVTYGAKLSFGF